ncbi:MAG TPA: glycosyltransferase [Vicinamibacteria bacterium]
MSTGGLELVVWAAAAVVGYAYVGYPLLIALAARIRPARPVARRPITPAVSVIIVARDEERCLGAKIESCLALDYPRDRLDVLVVSDGSEDRTEAIVTGYADRGVRLLALRTPRGKAAALNAGVAATRSEVLLLTDARQHLAPDALRALVADLADPAVAAASGELHLASSATTAVAEGVGLYWDYEKMVRRAESRFDSSVGVTGALYAIRRERFTPLDPRTILDDVALPMAAVLAGHRVVFEPLARATDTIAATPTGEYRRKVRTLAGNYQLVRLQPALLDPRRNRILWQFVSHKLARLAVPWCLAAMAVASGLLAAAGDRVFALLAAGQAAFATLAALGALGARRGWRPRALTLPYTFALLNVAAAHALFRFLRGTDTAGWRPASAPARRAPAARGPARPDRPRVMFVFSKFPMYDEAFLHRELEAISREVDTAVFSLKRSRDTIVHAEARAVAGPLVSPPLLFSRAVLASQWRELRRSPAAYLGALLGVVRAHLRSPNFLVRTLACFPMAVHLADWARRHGVTHLHAMWATYPASVAMIASELTGLPFSFAGHAHDLYLDATNLGAKVRAAAFVSTCTESNRAFLRGVAPEVAPERLLVLRHGVSIARFSAPPRPPDGPLEILSVGTLNPHKGFTYLLDALAVVREAGLDFRATIVGGGPLEAALRRRLQQRGLEGLVTLTGALEQSRIVPLYRRAAVFVLMAQAEWHWGIPNVIVEALAARAAVITTRFGSVEELVQDGVTGLLVPGKDAEPLAGAILRLADDPVLRERLAEAGHRAVARDFDLATSVQAYVRRFRGTSVAARSGALPAAPEPAAARS